MKIQISTLTFILFSFFLSGQTTNVLIQSPTQKFKVGDAYYHNNFKGIGYLMNDLKLEGSELYEKMQPQYEEILKKRKNSNIILALGSSVGGILFISGTSSLIANVDNLDQDPTEVIAPLLAGVVIIGLSGIIYTKKKVNSQDILNFTNQFNRVSEKEKIEFSFRPNINLNNGFSGGLAINLRF